MEFEGKATDDTRKMQIKSEFLILLQQPKSASKERRYPIFVTLERGLNASMEGEHSTRK